MSWNLSNDRPIYLQLMEQIQIQILSGKYNPGDHFPSVRELASEAAVNPNTMQKALSSLEQQGLLINGRTTGRTVTSDHSMIQMMKQEIVSTKFNEFRQSLTQLGFTEEEIKEIIMKEYDV